MGGEKYYTSLDNLRAGGTMQYPEDVFGNQLNARGANRIPPRDLGLRMSRRCARSDFSKYLTTKGTKSTKNGGDHG